MKKTYQITFALVACLFIAASVQAKGWVYSTGKGLCITSTYHYDEEGDLKGTSTTITECKIPRGFYTFDFSVPRGDTSNPTPLNPVTRKSLGKKDSFYTLSLQILEVVRASDKKSSGIQNKIITIPAEYGMLIQEGLKNGKKIMVSIPRGYFSSSMQERLQK